MRGATRPRAQIDRKTFISIHAPHAGSDEYRVCLFPFLMGFQSTLPMRGATRFSNSAHLPFQFQSTLPMRGATYAVGIIVQAILISIHAPHAGSDAALPVELQGHINFNPRSPCGERLDANGFETVEPISIHAPHAGSDGMRLALTSVFCHFNPRSPCGERPRFGQSLSGCS